MSVQKAIVVVSPQKEGLVSDRPIPALRDDYILVKTVSVALNPTDWKHIAYVSPVGSLIGCDYAGIVEEVGKDVKKPFKKGDRICGFAHGGNASQLEDGAFAEYVVVKGDVQSHIPENLSFQEAATLGVGITTVGQALYQSLKLALPTQPISKEKSVHLLIYGGSTATGSLAIQFAKLSGYTVLTTCSPRNFDLVKSLGADAVFDYNDPNAAAEIRKYTDDKLTLAFDTITTSDSAKFCGEALSSSLVGDCTLLANVNVERENVRSRWTLGYTALGESFDFGPVKIEAKPEDKEYAAIFWELATKLLGEGKIKVHPPKVNPGGLKGVLDGLQLLRDNKVSGEKLVYNVDETD
ncbi:zinc-binding oxidoreductase [Talaromyces proteolyticus]|uniref:Zinc-binding oxidoreductase n=1 Tax=Talaromyces proteolyticus TaxID=1131652 RepID=A0AAD4KVV1_9EURO|nr:zinc-binding oxidoreductase [Talaromyces proteolyticus]KAH8697836.1 zinc-binding oxidoreductase [Talaromyces proteolyticus]